MTDAGPRSRAASSSPTDLEQLDGADDVHGNFTGSSRQRKHPEVRKNLAGDARRLLSMSQKSEHVQYEPLGPGRQSERSSMARSLRLALILGVVMVAAVLVVSFLGGSTLGSLVDTGPERPKSVTLDWQREDDWLSLAGNSKDDYPTDLTRDITPIPCHSHNDYWRKLPLVEALHYGCIGVEADVWLRSNDLLVGHNTASLTKTRTFRSLYVDPLIKLLDRQNPKTDMQSTGSKHGVFDTDHEQTLILLVDFKSSPDALWPVVLDQLEPLRSKGYLSHYNGTDFVSGPVTVVGTGNLPFETILSSSLIGRHVFMDAPLDALEDGFVPSARRASALRRAGQTISGSSARRRADKQSPVQFNASNSYYASTDFSRAIGRLVNGRLTDEQTKLIRRQVEAAAKLGLQSRYWGTPLWPVHTRNHVWRALYEAGAHIINVDDLRAAASDDW